MNRQTRTIQDERGFVLIAALMIMLVLTIIGIAATTNTSIELQIAGNDKVHKRTFYEAEAGAMLGSELLEQNFNCPTGFTNAAVPLATPTIRISTGAFANNPAMHSAALPDPTDSPANPNIVPKLAAPAANSDAAYPLTGGVLATQEVGYLYYGGSTELLAGGALQMAAGYEGKGKSSAQGGVAKMVDIYSQFRGLLNSEAVVLFGWRHIVGSESSCLY